MIAAGLLYYRHQERITVWLEARVPDSVNKKLGSVMFVPLDELSPLKSLSWMPQSATPGS